MLFALPIPPLVTGGISKYQKAVVVSAGFLVLLFSALWVPSWGLSAVDIFNLT